MLLLTKIVQFEMAHAIEGYAGACKNIHGHSYELQVTVSSVEPMGHEFIPAAGFIFDFKELKKMVLALITETFDHKLVLSRNYLTKNPELQTQENLVAWEAEPTAENMLIYIRLSLEKNLPKDIKLAGLKLYETKDSFAEWKE